MQKHDTSDERDNNESAAGIPVPVRDYSLDGLSIRGDIPLSKVVTAVKNFCRLQTAGNEVGNAERLAALEDEVALKKGVHKVCLGFSVA